MAMQATQFADRRQFHAAFNEWLDNATEAEFQQLESAKEAFAGHGVCSMYTLITQGLTDPTAAALFPKSLAMAMVQAQPKPVGSQLYVVGGQSAAMQ